MMNNKRAMKVANLSVETFYGLLDSAIVGRLCVQAWLGHGDAMFLGLGGEVSPPPTPCSSPTGISYLRHHQPDYELQTYSSDWILRDGDTIRASSFDDPKAREGCTSLLGLKALAWHFLHPSWGISVTFDSGILFEVLPYKDGRDADSDAWGLRGPGGLYSIIRLNGECYTVSGDQPAGT